jgi:uncharacterized protein YxeA
MKYALIAIIIIIIIIIVVSLTISKELLQSYELYVTHNLKWSETPVTYQKKNVFAF